jgi:peptide-methionine (S)-S-oxide reductase
LKLTIKIMENEFKTAVLGGGCFWCLEAVFSHVKGIHFVISGYAGDKEENPTYEQVSSGSTGHAEVIEIKYDPSIISYEDILHIYFSVHDPTTKDRQGNDVGTQYRSVIFYSDNSQKKIANDVIKEFTDNKIFENPILTKVAPLVKFYKAEEYHQKYFQKNPGKAYCQIMISPKIGKLRQKFSEFYE